MAKEVWGQVTALCSVQCYETVVLVTGSKYLQDLASSWDGRPFGHNRRGPKSGGLLCPFPWDTAAPPFSAHVYCPPFLAHVYCLCLSLCRFLDRPFPHWDAGWWKPTCSGWKQPLYASCMSVSYPCNGILRHSRFQSLCYMTTRFYWAFHICWNHSSNLYLNFQFALLSCTIFVFHFLCLWVVIHYSQHFLPFSAT